MSTMVRVVVRPDDVEGVPLGGKSAAGAVSITAEYDRTVELTDGTIRYAGVRTPLHKSTVLDYWQIDVIAADATDIVRGAGCCVTFRVEVTPRRGSIGRSHGPAMTTHAKTIQVVTADGTVTNLASKASVVPVPEGAVLLDPAAVMKAGQAWDKADNAENIATGAVTAAQAAQHAAEVAEGAAFATVDTGTAELITNPTAGPNTQAAIDTRFGGSTKGLVTKTADIALNARDFGITASAASAAIQAAHDALPAKGGSILLPYGDYECASTINITKPVKITGAGGTTEYGATRLLFAAGVKGMDVRLPDSGDRFHLEGVALISRSTSASAGSHGLHIKKGRAFLQNVSAQKFGGHGIFFDSTATVDNANHALGIGVRAYENRGDGIRIEGENSNAITLIGPDVVANYGWGINNMGHHNVFTHPHADQQYNGSPGAYRDTSISSWWQWPYSEGAKELRIDTGSAGTRVDLSAYGKPVINKLVSNEIAVFDASLPGVVGAWNIQGVEANPSTWRIDSGVVGGGAFGICYAAGPKGSPKYMAYIFRDLQWFLLDASPRPAVNATHDLGDSSARWKDAYLSGVLNLGSLKLRNNSGSLQVSSDGGSTWKTVTVT